MGSNRRRLWTEKEDQILKVAIIQYGTRWKPIASYFESRTPSQCAQRWKRIKNYRVSKRAYQQVHRQWTKDEDCLVLRLYTEYGGKWNQMSGFLPQRTGRQIRERFINYLNPKINRAPWTEEEDQIIWDLYLKYGKKWALISRMLLGRPENSIKNRFYSVLHRRYTQIENPYYQLQISNDVAQNQKFARLEEISHQFQDSLHGFLKSEDSNSNHRGDKLSNFVSE